MRINIWTALLLTALAMGLVVRNGWVMLDDTDLVLDNQNVIEFNVKDIWIDSTTLTYVPLTVTTFALEYLVVGDNPFLYHLNNLLLHLLVVFLIYRLLIKLGASARVSAVAALLFGVHPMHVESVAWITERKDVLYAALYVGGLIFYTDYAKLHTMRGAWPEKARWRMMRHKWWIAFLLIILSLFAKSMALSFAFIALLIDWYVGRKFSRSMVVDKIPFFVVSFIIALVTYVKVSGADALAGASAPEWEDQILYYVASIVWYPLKFFVPANVSPIYKFPTYVNTDNLYYQLRVAGVVGWMMSLWLYRSNRTWVFANAFYILSAFFLWRTTNNDFHPVADRFMYLPSLGYCLLIARWINRSRFFITGHIIIPDKARMIGVTMLVVYLVVAASGATRHWHSEYSMYKRAQRIEDDNALLRKYLAAIYTEELNDPKKAMDQANLALEENPNDTEWMLWRAQLWEELGDNNRAFIDYYRTLWIYDYYLIEKDPNYYAAYMGAKRNEAVLTRVAGKMRGLQGQWMWVKP